MDKKIPSGAADCNASELKLKGFKVYEVGTGVNAVPTYNRRDFYKICINTGRSLIHYANKGIQTEGTIAFFGNPRIPYSWEVISPTYTGYACVFTEDFLKSHERFESLQQSPLFKIGGTPIFQLDEGQKLFMTAIFQRMLAEQDTTYLDRKSVV